MIHNKILLTGTIFILAIAGVAIFVGMFAKQAQAMSFATEETQVNIVWETTTISNTVYLPLVTKIYPPQLGKVVFVSNRDGNYEIYTMNSDGTGVTRLTNNTANDFNPTWSPDGLKIAFTSNSDGDYRIYTMNSDGTEVTQLISYTVSSSLDWSPDGTKIVFASNNDGNVEIYSIKPDGTEITRLTYDPQSDSMPTWSGNNTQIAFWSWRFFPGIYTMNADGSNPSMINGSSYVHGISWSLDNTRLALTIGGGTDHSCDQIYIQYFSGTGPSQLTQPPSCNTTPNWSPDSTKIIFASDRDGNYEIYIMNADGTGAIRLTDNSAIDTSPDWTQ